LTGGRLQQWGKPQRITRLGQQFLQAFAPTLNGLDLQRLAVSIEQIKVKIGREL
jgi:hypothetical protein